MNIEAEIKRIDDINPKYKKKMGLNQKEVAELLGVSASTLEARRKDGTGIEYVTMGGRIIYTKVKIAEFLSNTVKTA